MVYLMGSETNVDETNVQLISLVQSLSLSPLLQTSANTHNYYTHMIVILDG